MKKRANTYVTILKAVFDLADQSVCPSCEGEAIVWSSFAPNGCSWSVAECLLSILVEKKKITEAECETLLCGCMDRRLVLTLIKRIESEK